MEKFSTCFGSYVPILYEAGIAFRSVKQDLLDEAVKGDDEGMAKLEYLRKSFSMNGSDALHYAYMKPIRDNMAFHYKMEPLREALEEHVGKKDLHGVLVISEFLGLSRYSVADHLFNSELRKILGVNLIDYQKAFMTRMGEVAQLADALSHLVDLLLVKVMEAQQNAILNIEHGKLVVPSAVSRARRRRLKALNEQKGI